MAALFGKRALEKPTLSKYSLGRRAGPHEEYSLAASGFYEATAQTRNVTGNAICSSLCDLFLLTFFISRSVFLALVKTFCPNYIRVLSIFWHLFLWFFPFFFLSLFFCAHQFRRPVPVVFRWRRVWLLMGRGQRRVTAAPHQQRCVCVRRKDAELEDGWRSRQNFFFFFCIWFSQTPNALRIMGSLFFWQLSCSAAGPRVLLKWALWRLRGFRKTPEALWALQKRFDTKKEKKIQGVCWHLEMKNKTKDSWLSKANGDSGENGCRKWWGTWSV